MIMIEVEVPMLGSRYDFQLEETMLTNVAIPEIADMICRRQQCRLEGDERELCLWDMKTRLELDRSRTIDENGLRTGDRVMLV